MYISPLILKKNVDNLKPHTYEDDLEPTDSPFDKSAIGMNDYNVLVI